MDQYESAIRGALTSSLQDAAITGGVTGTFGDYSGVFIDAATGDALGSVSADGKTVSVFNYNTATPKEMISIDQYESAIRGAMPTSWTDAAITSVVTGTFGDYSRVFIDAATGDALGSVIGGGKSGGGVKF